MRHFKPLSPIFLSSLIVVSFVFALSPSCRKLKDVDLKPENELVQKFFHIPEDASDELRDVIANIKKQEDKYHFVNRLTAKYGLPAWDKSIANVPVRNTPNAVSGRSATADSLQIFLIPFRANDSSVSSYLACARNGNDFTYRYYKKDNLSTLYAANDTITELREGLLGIFGYFEKNINNDDSTLITGIYNKVFSEVEIKINGIPVNARTANAGLSLIEVCYSVSSSTGPQQRSQIVPVIHCIVVGVYGSLLDLGFTSSNGYSSGGSGGSGGGGSSGGNTFPDGFQCPQSEWWCESGDYRFINGVLYTAESYPGINNGFPWLWWENPVWVTNNPFSYIEFALDVPDDPIINNGIELSDVPADVPINPQRLIGYSPSRGNVEDMQYGTNGDASGIYPHLLSKSDDELFTIMNYLFNSCTVFDSDLETVGDLMIDRFRNRTGGSYENSVLNEKVKNSSAFRNYLKNFGNQLRDQLIQTGGNIDNVSSINMGDVRPIFNGFYNKFHGLQILINDTEYTDINLENYELSSDGTWYADVTVKIHDHFGLDKNDALEYQEWHQGFPSWWILQHMRDYRPFETVSTVRMRISGSL